MENRVPVWRGRLTEDLAVVDMRGRAEALPVGSLVRLVQWIPSTDALHRSGYRFQASGARGWRDWFAERDEPLPLAPDDEVVAEAPPRDALQAARDDERERIAKSIERAAKELRGRDGYTRDERQWLRDLARQIRERAV